MEMTFLAVLNMSLTASFVIATIMLARIPLKKAPKIFSFSLWAVAGFRLVFPFTLESVFSLLPFKSTPIPQDIAIQVDPRIDSGITIIDNAVSAALPGATPVASVNPLQVWIAVGSYIWLFGVAIMLIYSFVSIVILKNKLRSAALIEGNLYEADNLMTPFVIGLFRPKIYIPVGLTGDESSYIILHEQTHVKRRDHAVKMFAYLVLCLHWFNPLAWVAFILMSADMEMSCDERVMKELGGEIKNAYSLSLVRLAAGRKILNGSPLAFGEGGMKERIKNVLNFKKPSRVIITLAIALVAMLSVGFALNRTEDADFKSALDPSQESPRTYYLENPTEKDMIERLRSVTLYSDGRAELATPPISSYMMPKCTFTITNDELLIHAMIKTEFDENFFGVKDDEVIARFIIADDNTLVFQSATVALFADSGARYVYAQSTPAPAYEVREWLNYYLDERMPWGRSLDLKLPEYPDTVFAWTSYEVKAIDSKGEKILFSGMPIWNIYLADLTGDSLPELCATVSFGSGIVDTRVVVYDYANDKLYELSDRGYFDYALTLEDGRLIATKSEYNGAPLTAGDLEIFGDELIIADITKQQPQEITMPEDSYELIQRVENGLRIIMSSPLSSSNPQDYINAHQDEYEDLTMKYSDGVLEYLLSEFEAGNSDGLRGQIMMRMCKSILGPSNNVTDESLSPQEWYRQLSVISETLLPDFKPEEPEGEFGGLIYSAVIQHYSQLADGFTVAAPTVYGAYEEEGKLKIFVTVYTERYKLYDKTLVSVGGSVIPAAMVFGKDRTGGWELEEYLEVGSANLPDGAHSGDSIRKLCVMPVSGKEIQGLAEKMNTDYSNDTRRELLMQNLKEHLITYGQIGVSLQMSDGSMVKLT